MEKDMSTLIWALHNKYVTVKDHIVSINMYKFYVQLKLIQEFIS